MKRIKRKAIRIIETELDNIIEHQKNKNALPKDPLFEDFDENFKEKLKKHDQFMQRIYTSFNSTKR